MTLIASYRPTSNRHQATQDSLGDRLSLLNAYLARFPIITEFQLYELNNLEKLRYFLSQSNDLLVTTAPVADTKAIVLNHLPALHAYPPHEIIALYIQNPHQPDSHPALYHYHIGHDAVSEDALVYLANSILKVMGERRLIYTVNDFEIGLYLMIPPNHAHVLGLSNGLDDRNPPQRQSTGLDATTANAYTIAQQHRQQQKEASFSSPYDLSEIYADPDMQFMLSRAKDYNIHDKGSMSAQEAYHWLGRQKARMLAWTYTALPDELIAWQTLEPISRFRRVYNLFVALARHFIDDARIIDERYKRYPLMDERSYQNIVARLVDEPNVEKSVIDFFFAETIMALWLLPTQEHETIRLCLNNAD